LQKFLIIQTAFIGDVVLATALVEKLHAYFPEAQIDFLLRKGNEQLLTGHPFIHEILIWNKKTDKQRNLIQMIFRIRKNKYSKVINVQRFFATGLITVCSGAEETIGFDKNPLSFLFSKKIKHKVGGSHAVHETVRNLQLVRNFTDNTFYMPKLYPSPDDFDRIEELATEKYITISPASVWFTKQYPADQWIRFIKRIPEELTIYLLGGPGDVLLCQSILGSSNRERLILMAGDLSYLQSAALMSRARMNYVNDSAPMHFASAMNAPVTAIYCSTVPEFGFGPLSAISHIIEVEEPLNCRPCGLHGYSSCPQGHFKCAIEISDMQLINTIPA
jgi:ADP-heptose:LPS heptosyltransferase